jgi:septal ring factor EnvC (AmiA/AmiB activator)
MNAVRLLLIPTISFCFFFYAGHAQKTKTQLQKERQQSLQKIKEVEKIKNETSAKKKNSIGELNALSQRITEQEKLIYSIKEEIRLLDSDITENNDIIDALKSDLKKLKQEYAAMLYAAQRTNNNVTRLSFLFSAKSFEQLLMRLKYIEQYGESRKIQAKQILNVQEELSGQVREIQNKRTQKSSLLNEGLAQSNRLSSLKKEKDGMVRSLEKEEKQLERDLEETKKALAILDKKINEIILEEIAREAKEAKSKEAIALSSSFEDNRLKFPWPVSGFISQKFGRQDHPVLKGIVTQNDGVNIQTSQEEKVKSIFEGEVRSVAAMPTLGNTVIINHGEYYTVYSGLKEVYVKRGQKVRTNQEIGVVLSNTEGISELRFQIRKQFQALDPQLWLRNM